jgi:hypothetical protein
MLTQLQTPIPLGTPKGKAWAVAIIDYGPQWDLLWVTFVHTSGECWTFNNKDIRQEENFTFGLMSSPFNGGRYHNGHGKLEESLAI